MTNAKTSPLDQAVAAAIAAELRPRGITLRALAEATDIPERTLSRYLKGERPITVGQLIRFAESLGVTVDYLLKEARKRQGE